MCCSLEFLTNLSTVILLLLLDFINIAASYKGGCSLIIELNHNLQCTMDFSAQCTWGCGLHKFSGPPSRLSFFLLALQPLLMLQQLCSSILSLCSRNPIFCILMPFFSLLETMLEEGRAKFFFRNQNGITLASSGNV